MSVGKLPSEKTVQWWPPLGVILMLILGFSVGKDSTPFDRWFFDATQVAFGVQPRWLLFFTDWVFLVPVLVVCVGFELYRRRWRVATVVLVCPFIANWTTQATKMLVGREKGGYLAYPSGHTTFVVAVTGMLVLVAGGALWAYIAAAIVSMLGLLGQVACGYHYFTDTIGAVLVTTAVVTLAFWAAGQSSSSAASTSSDKSTLV
ncbi:phosphatase PAP2 family protein [Mycobacteroides chelonae]|uniref:Phosphatase PAP2 family protein n=1 Tax=Mycobacteroides chelonae TaxID=1774 RepID=A0AB73U2T8_MYCCH|nr:phosphatase PAP2 family protein [Mycobacteroides chelonae]MEC4840421.1 phosphatase PAP2 family protein [Mycobacteroides chelonae]MEC4843443.1 phosphatase PAP2 family protein [Mycobacteroides chelonae]QDF71227.1 phosphatase PAP2 family protein [Mycobacteroides chelonae]WED92692.1 phosphatase PAP2 family protein [Mycobacteroides chelonae]WED95090.1 phosphatase PAP2 family protein [Mycobacteroides chelonae]